MEHQQRTRRRSRLPTPPWLWLLLIAGLGLIFWQFVPKIEVQVPYYAWFVEQVERDNIKSLSVQGIEMRGELRKEQPYLSPYNSTKVQVRKFTTNAPSEALIGPIVQKLIESDKTNQTEGKRTGERIRIDAELPNSASGLAWIMLLLPTFLILGLIYLMMRQGRIQAKPDKEDEV